MSDSIERLDRITDSLNRVINTKHHPMSSLVPDSVLYEHVLDLTRIVRELAGRLDAMERGSSGTARG